MNWRNQLKVKRMNILKLLKTKFAKQPPKQNPMEMLEQTLLETQGILLQTLTDALLFKREYQKVQQEKEQLQLALLQTNRKLDQVNAELCRALVVNTELTFQLQEFQNMKELEDAYASMVKTC